MNKQEFEKLINGSVSNEDYKIIELVYTYHPSIPEVNGKGQIATLYQLGGMLKNNGQNFYSQAWTGKTTLSSLIGTLGAIPTAAGMVVVWPLANKFGKANTIKWGALLAVILGFHNKLHTLQRPLYLSGQVIPDG